MCGIFGAIGQENYIPKALKALSRLEYRGYDSAGMAFLLEIQSIVSAKLVGVVT